MSHKNDKFAGFCYASLMEKDASSLQGNKAFEASIGFPSNFEKQIPSYRVVIDACVIRNEIRRYLSSSDKLTFIQEAHQSGVGVIHAPKWLEIELETSTLPSLYRTEGISTRILDRAAEHILEEINIHDAYNRPQNINSPNGTDPKDEPYVRLARDIEALGVLSWDKGFKKYNVNAFKEDVILQMQHLARLLNAGVQLRTAGKLSTVVAVNLAEEIFKTVPKLASKIPSKALLPGGVFVGGAFYYLMCTNHGRQNRKRYTEIVSRAAIASLGFYKSFQDEYDENLKSIATLTNDIKSASKMQT